MTDGRTDGRTDRQTDGRAIAYSALSMLSRAKKQNKQLFPVVCWLRWLVGWLGDSFVCKHLVGTSSWDATHFNVSLRHFCSRSTSFPSVLEVYHDYVLYKFTIDIDIDRTRKKDKREECVTR